MDHVLTNIIMHVIYRNFVFDTAQRAISTRDLKRTAAVELEGVCALITVRLALRLAQQLVEKGQFPRLVDKKIAPLIRAQDKRVVSSTRKSDMSYLNQLLVTNTSNPSFFQNPNFKFNNFNFDSAPHWWLFSFAFFILNFAILTKL